MADAAPISHLSLMGVLKAAKARAEEGKAAAVKLFETIDNGVAKLQQHHGAVAGHFDGILSFVEEMIQGGEEIVHELDGAGKDSNLGTVKPSLGGVLDAFEHIDAGKAAAALAEAIGVAEPIVGKVAEAYLGAASGGIATALAAAAEAAAGAGVAGPLASDIAHAVQMMAHVLKDEPAGADPRPVAQAVKAHIDTTDAGGDAREAAKQAAQAAGASAETADRIAGAVSAAP